MHKQAGAEESRSDSHGSEIFAFHSALPTDSDRSAELRGSVGRYAEQNETKKRRDRIGPDACGLLIMSLWGVSLRGVGLVPVRSQ